MIGILFVPWKHIDSQTQQEQTVCQQGHGEKGAQHSRDNQQSSKEYNLVIMSPESTVAQLEEHRIDAWVDKASPVTQIHESIRKHAVIGIHFLTPEIVSTHIESDFRSLFPIINGAVL